MKNLLNHVILILAFYLIGNVNLAQAQSANHDAYYKTGERDMSRIMFSKFETAMRGVRTDNCINAAIFAQFTISTKGTISNLKLLGSKTALDMYSDAIKSVIESTNGNWVPKTINHKAVESDIFVQPVIIEMDDCSKILTSNTFKVDMLSFFSTNDNKAIRKVNMLGALKFGLDK